MILLCFQDLDATEKNDMDPYGTSSKSPRSAIRAISFVLIMAILHATAVYGS